MRSLESNEIQAVSGGEPVMIFSFIAGMKGASFAKTVAFSGIFYGLVGATAGGVLGAIGSAFGSQTNLAQIGLGAGIVLGSLDASVFYGLGSLFHTPSPQMPMIDQPSFV